MESMNEHHVTANQTIIDAMVDVLRVSNRVANEVLKKNENADLNPLTDAQEKYIDELKKLMLEELNENLYRERWE